MLVCFATPFGKRPSSAHYRSKAQVQASRLADQFINVEVDLLIVSKARNTLVQAIPPEADVVWFVDSDIKLPANAGILLDYVKEHPVVSGLYFSRFPPFLPQVYNRVQPGVTDFAFVPVVNLPEEPFQADAVGAGCLVVQRRVLDAVAEKHAIWQGTARAWLESHQKLQKTPKSPEWLAARRALELGLVLSAHWEFLEACGEDFYFCEQIRHHLDIRPFVVPSVECQHEGIRWVGRPDWESTLGQRGITFDADVSKISGGSL